MKKILSLFLVFAILLCAAPAAVFADAPAVFVSAADITTYGMTIKLDKNLTDGQTLKINGEAVTSEGADGEYKIDMAFALDTSYVITLDNELVYAFELEKIAEGSNLTLGNNTDNYYAISDSGYKVDVTIDKATSPGGRFELYKYTNGNNKDNAQGYAARSYTGGYFAFAKGVGLSYNASYMNPEYYGSAVNVQKKIDEYTYGVYLGNTAPWAANDAKCTFYEENGTNNIVINGIKVISGELKTQRTSGGIILKTQDTTAVTVSAFKAYKVAELGNTLKNVTYLKDGIYLEFEKPAALGSVKDAYALTDENGITIPLTAVKSAFQNNIVELKANLDLDKTYTFNFESEYIKGTAGKTFILKTLLSNDFTSGNGNWVNAERDGSTMRLKGGSNNRAYYNGAELDGQSNYAVEVTAVQISGKTPRLYIESVNSTPAATTNGANGFAAAVRDYSGNWPVISFLSNKYGVYLGEGTYMRGDSELPGIGKTKLYGSNPFAGGDTKIAYSAINGNQLLTVNGGSVLTTALTLDNAAGGVSMWTYSEGNTVNIKNFLVYKAVEVKDITVTGAYANSNGVVLTCDGELLAAPSVTIDGEPADITVNGSNININYDFESKKAYKLEAVYNRNKIYSEIIKRNLKFADACNGTDISKLWDVFVTYNDGQDNSIALEPSAYVSYSNGKLSMNLKKFYGNFKNFYILLAPKAFREIGAEGNQTVEYKISVENKEHADIMAFMLSETSNYNDTNARNMFVKFDVGGTRVRHTFGNNPVTYWAQASNGLQNGENSVAQSVYNGKVRVSLNGIDIIDNSNENVTERGAFAFRVNSTFSEQTITLSDIKAYELEVIDGVNISEFKIENGTASAKLINYNGGAGAVLAFYSANKEELLGCRVIDNVTADIVEFTNVTVPDGAVSAAIYLWGLSDSSFKPMCKSQKIIFN